MADIDNGQKATPTLSSGDKLGKYEVQEVLGVGGQSVVYKGYDELLDRHVAIKQLAPHLLQDEAYLAHTRENVRTIAKLGAKNEAIVTILDIIEEQRGMFYVMEYVQGPTLQQVINESAVPTEPKAVLLILFRLAAALHDVHAEGIVHRDLKPSNIIITEGLRPKIIDFGVAALHDGDISMPLATTKYLAPEVYTADTIDGRADIYSLGFIAYELLLGPEKFNEVFEDVVRDKHSAALRWMKWHGNESVEAPPLHEVDPSIPLSLSHLVARMLEKNPENRFQNTEELGRAMKESFSTKTGKKKAGHTGAGGARPGGSSSGRTHAGGSLYEEGIREIEGDLPPALPGQRSAGVVGGEGPATAPLPMDEGPETAPLPKGPMSRKTKIRLAVAGGVVLLALIGGAIGWMVHQRGQARQRLQQAEQLFAQAMDDYKNENYAAAIEQLTTIRRTYGRTVFARKASVRQPMAEAWLAIEEHRWDEAQLRENEADDALDVLHKQAGSQSLTEWTRRVKDEIDDLGRTRLSTQSFYTALERAEAMLREATREEDYVQAIRTLEKDLGTADITMTPEQEAEAADLKNRISRQRVIGLFNTYLADADQQRQMGNLARAEEIYNLALGILESSDPAVKLVPVEQRQQMQQQVQGKLQDVARAQKTSAKRQALAEAERGGSPIAVRQALDALLKEELPADDRARYQQRLRELEVQTGLVEAKQALADGNQTAAKVALDRVLQAAPDNAEAKSMLANIEKATQKQQLISEGDALLAERSFADALKKYSQAARMGGASADLRDKIGECNFNIALQQALDAREVGKYTDAERLYERAKTLKPDAQLVIDAQIEDMRVDQAFDTLKAKADELITQKKWDEAIKTLQQAREGLTAGKLQRKQAAETGIKFAKYNKYMTLGDEAAARGEAPTARFYYGMAQREMNTPEIKKKLQSVGG